MTDVLTPREFVKIVEEETGESIRYHEISNEAFDKIKDVPELYELWAKCVLFLIMNTVNDQR